MRYYATWAILGPDVIHHAGIAIGHFSARPVPILKAVFNGLVAFVGVHVGMATPAEMGLVHFNFYTGAGRNRAPAVQAFVV